MTNSDANRIVLLPSVKWYTTLLRYRGGGGGYKNKHFYASLKKRHRLQVYSGNHRPTAHSTAGRDAEHLQLHDSNYTIKAKQPALSSSPRKRELVASE